MELKQFIISVAPDDRDGFSSRCGTSWAHLRNVALYGKTCGESLAINIERETKGAVTCEDLRPDVDWQYLRGTQKAA